MITDVCKYNLDPGPCEGNIKKYYWNRYSRQCDEFTYGGCHGGPNRFSTKQECQKICDNSKSG